MKRRQMRSTLRGFRSTPAGRCSSVVKSRSVEIREWLQFQEPFSDPSREFLGSKEQKLKDTHMLRGC